MSQSSQASASSCTKALTWACNSAITASLARSRSRAARVSVSILRHLDGFGQHALRRHQIVRHAAAGIFDHAGDAQNTRPSGGTVKRPLRQAS
jgi:hypothetical protein